MDEKRDWDLSFTVYILPFEYPTKRIHYVSKKKPSEIYFKEDTFLVQRQCYIILVYYISITRSQHRDFMSKDEDHRGYLWTVTNQESVLFKSTVPIFKESSKSP